MAGPGHGRGMGGPKAKNPGKTLRRVFSYMAEYKLRMVVVAIAILMSAGAGVAGTYFLKPLINGLEELVGKPNPDLSGLVRTLTTMACIYLIGAIGNYIANRVIVTVSTGTLFKIRTDLYAKMERLPLKYFDSHPHGELMSRYTNDVDALRETVGNTIPNLLSSTVQLVGVFAMMIYLSPLLTLLVVGMFVVMVFIVKTLGGKSGAYFRKQQEELGKVNGYIEEMIEGQKVVKVFNHEDEAAADFDVLNNAYAHAATNAQTYASMLMPIMGNLGYILYALVAGIGGAIGIAGLVDLGTIASYLQYTRSFSQPITQISQQFNAILVALAGAERIFALIDEEPEQDEGTVTLVNAERTPDGLKETDHRTGTWAWKVPEACCEKLVAANMTEPPQKTEGGYLVPVCGNVQFADVDFSYDGKKQVLNNVSLFAHPGQKIAFVGSTGAGKTTITNLINRFYDITDGTITYDGIPLREIRKDDLRRSLAMVLQDAHLFTGTVRENIRYGKLDATDEEIERAAKLANAHWFIEHLPEGYDTVLTADGANLSQGQRQLLTIARAAVADPPVLILDEATSSIDTRTEALIEKGMDSLMEGRTVFVIAHRLSTVRNSDAIMVLEHGEIIERGNHDELIRQKGRYYQLYTGAFELS